MYIGESGGSQVGITLQAASESANGAEASLSPEDLHALATARFIGRGFDADQAQTHAAELVDVTTKRLVLLVPRDGGVGFDIRTLQELMAARALTEGDDTQIATRLRLIAHPRTGVTPGCSPSAISSRPRSALRSRSSTCSSPSTPTPAASTPATPRRPRWQRTSSRPQPTRL